MSSPLQIGGLVALSGCFTALARSTATSRLGLAELAPARKSLTLPAALQGERARWMALAIVGAAFGAVLAGPAGSVVGAGGCLGAQAVTRRRRASRRADILEAQLADAVGAIAAALRGGLSLSQAVSYAAREVEEPLAGTLARAARRESLGEPLDVALTRWAEEVGGEDVRLVVGVLALHRRTGGDLPRVLDRVVETLRDRRATAREVRALTAQARLSGAILGALPIAFFLFLAATSRRDVAAAFQTGPGIVSLLVGLLLEGAAFLWIRKLLRVA